MATTRATRGKSKAEGIKFPVPTVVDNSQDEMDDEGDDSYRAGPSTKKAIKGKAKAKAVYYDDYVSSETERQEIGDAERELQEESHIAKMEPQEPRIPGTPIVIDDSDEDAAMGTSSPIKETQVQRAQGRAKSARIASLEREKAEAVAAKAEVQAKEVPGRRKRQPTTPSATVPEKPAAKKPRKAATPKAPKAPKMVAPPAVTIAQADEAVSKASAPKSRQRRISFSEGPRNYESPSARLDKDYPPLPSTPRSPANPANTDDDENEFEFDPETDTVTFSRDQLAKLVASTSAAAMARMTAQGDRSKGESTSPHPPPHHPQLRCGYQQGARSKVAHGDQRTERSGSEDPEKTVSACIDTAQGLTFSRTSVSSQVASGASGLMAPSNASAGQFKGQRA
ncbi:hypothetical protein B0H10DRAFT_2227503 [Mycena sp. CBHHK59/15]|nr:hypothetical protein B0H10DRAFT_2227503 [Mycena sp. CBHHK59/15]